MAKLAGVRGGGARGGEPFGLILAQLARRPRAPDHMIRHGLDEEGRPGVASRQGRAFEIEQGRRLVLIERAIGEEMTVQRGDTVLTKAMMIVHE